MASQTALLETIANGFLARREELAEEMDVSGESREESGGWNSISLVSEVRNA
jgi:hypothetical protein